MSKIQEIILEPSKIYIGSAFKLKIRAIRHTTYKELKEQEKTYNQLKNFKYSDLKGE